MQITDKEISGALVVEVAGRLTAATEGLFKSEMSSLLTKADKLVFDCSQMEYLDSTGLGLIVCFYKDFKARGGKLALANLQPKPKLVFEITRANKIFDIYDTIEKAVEFVNSSSGVEEE